MPRPSRAQMKEILDNPVEATTPTTIKLLDKPIRLVTLAELAIAPENMRFKEDVDDQVEDLARTLLAGQLQPLMVREKIYPDDKPYMILDGRRRFLAFETLITDGDLPKDHPIGVIICDTAEEIAAASIVANTARLEVSKADYLIAIHDQLKSFKTPNEIGDILGLTPKAVRQLAKLGSLDRRFLELYREGTLTINNLKSIARIRNADELEELAKRAAEGHLWQHNVPSRPSGTISVDSQLARFVDLDAYQAAGGRIEKDLFEQVDDQMLDPVIAEELWMEAVRPIAIALQMRMEGVFQEPITSYNHPAPAGYAMPDYTFRSDTSADDIKELRETRDRIRQWADEALKDNRRSDWMEKLRDLAIADYDLHEAKFSPLRLARCRIALNPHYGLSFDFYVSTEDLKRHMQAQKGTSTPSVPRGSHLPNAKIITHTAGYSKKLHQVVTYQASKAIARSIAGNPTAALDAQISAQFQQCVLQAHDYGYTTMLLKLSLKSHAPNISNPDEILQKPMLDTLNEFKAAYTKSGLHPFQWVQHLTMTAKLELLAIITALQVDTSEVDPTALRYDARAEAAHVAKATGHDIRQYWTPDIDFWAGFSKKQLLAAMEDMGLDPKIYAKDKHEDIVPRVHEYAVEFNYVPPALNFELDETTAQNDNELDADEEDAA